MRLTTATLFVLLTLFACKNSEVETSPTPIFPGPVDVTSILDLTPTDPPFPMDQTAVSFYKDVAYDEDTLNVFDFFKPNNIAPSALFIYVHGGGFTNGDKTQGYATDFFKGLINDLLTNNIAVAAINYRFVENGNAEGILRSLNDSKRALQFMRYYSDTLNFNKDKVVMLGSSAGGGTVLWLGFNNDLADANNEDPILQESTRIQGLIATSTQSDYDFLEWHNNIFSEYQSAGFGYNSIEDIMSESTILRYYGVNDLSELNSAERLTDRGSLNILNLMSSDDPEFYLSTKDVAYTIPTNTSELYHHPLHVKALQDKAIQTNTSGIFYCPELEVDTRSGENIQNFILRKIGN